MNTLKLFFLLSIVTFFSIQGHSQPNNQFVLNGLGEINLDPPGNPLGKLVTMSPVEYENESFLKMTCQPTTVGVSIYLKVFHVVPGQTYTFLIDAIPSGVSPKIQIVSVVNNSTKVVVWPGASITKGKTKQLFSIPDGITEISVGFEMIAPEREEFLLIKDAGFFLGDVSPEQWQPLANEGLQPWLKTTYWYWLWLLFPLAVVALVILRKRGKRVK